MNQHEWNTCVDGAEMFNAAVSVGVDQKLLVAAACACARLTLPFVPEGEDRPRKAIEAAEGWAAGRVSVAAVLQAAVSASHYASFAITSDQSAGAYAVASARAARAAAATVAILSNEDDGPNAVFHVASAFYFSAVNCDTEGTAAQTADANRNAALLQCADIIRAHIPYQLIAIGVLEGI